MSENSQHGKQASLAALSLAALGIVFGDIGTSPLYTLQVGIAPEPGVHPLPADVLGVLSLIFWALTMVVTIKYIGFVMRADNQGEGGILALLALLPKPASPPGKVGDPARTALLARLPLIVGMVIAGAALLYGDGIITPAISVLSAMEGITIAAPKFKPAIVPLTCVVLALLFMIQRKGTGKLGAIFGPIMLLWFLVIAVMGAVQIAHKPEVLRALSPTAGAAYFVRHGIKGVPILGIVVLAITGGEALYADMGHFGPRPIRGAWMFVVFPALVLCYFGQGALVLRDPTNDVVLSNPFFAMAPGRGAALALVVLATAATVIASQALISGVFSLTQQAVQLGLFPRVTITHTAADAEGQIYVPELNWMLAVACIALVLAFRESAKLANAFGLAVSGTMMITSFAYYSVARNTWKWSMGTALLVLLLFLSFDIPFFVANCLKLFEGGFVPLVVGSVFFTVMVIWRRGRVLLGEHLRARMLTIKDFAALVEKPTVTRIPDAAIFLTGHDEGVPAQVALHVARLRSLQQQVILLTIHFEHVPTVDPKERASVSELGHGVHRVVLRYGYMEEPHVPEALADVLAKHSFPVDLNTVTYLLGRETIVPGPGGLMSEPVETLFAFLSRNSKSASAYFKLPLEQVVEIGLQVDL